MILLFLFLSPLLGAAFALAAARRIAAEAVSSSPFDAPFFRGAFYLIAIQLPVMGYFYHALPAWSLAYLIEPLRLPLSFGIVLAALGFSGYFFAYLATQSLLRAQRLVTAWLAAAQLGLTAVIFGIIFWEELTHAGTFYAFQTGLAPTVSASGMAPEILFGLALAYLPALAIIGWNAAEAKAYPSLEPEDSSW